MTVKTIQLLDQQVQVEEARYHAFQNFLRGPTAFGMVTDGMSLRDASAQEAMAFLVGQLSYTEATSFNVLYQPMQYESLVPISFEAGEWADQIRYEIVDYAGRGKRTSGKGRDIPLVDVAYAQKTFPVEHGSIGYDYSTEELRRSVQLRKPVTSSKPMAAMDGYQRHMNDVALFGETNLTGLFNNASVPQASAPVGAWLTGPKTPAQILNDVNTAINAVWTATAFNDLPTDIVIAPTCFAYIAVTPWSANSDKTILQYLKENNLAKVLKATEVNFTAGYGLETAGSGGTKRLMAYVKSPLRLVFHIPLPLRFLSPQMQGLSVMIPGEYKYSGVEFRYPKSAYYMDGL